MVGVDWWDAVGCTQSAAEDGIGKQLYLFLFYDRSANNVFLIIFYITIYATFFSDESCRLLFSVHLNSVIAVLDADFHSLPSIQHRQQYGPVCVSLNFIIALFGYFFYVINSSSFLTYLVNLLDITR